MKLWFLEGLIIKHIVANISCDLEPSKKIFQISYYVTKLVDSKFKSAQFEILTSMLLSYSWGIFTRDKKIVYWVSVDGFSMT